MRPRDSAEQRVAGHGAPVAQTLARANRDGDLRGADRLPHSSAFIAAVQQFLIKCGYAR